MGAEPRCRQKRVGGPGDPAADFSPTAAGFGGMVAPMAVAARTAHRDKPIWATEGGAELPVLYAAAGTALALAGPGRYSVDRALGIRVPPVLGLVALAGVVAGVAFTLRQAASSSDAADAAQTEAPTSDSITQDGAVELHAGEDAGVAVAPL